MLLLARIESYASGNSTPREASMHTGNAILDVIVRIVVIALVAAIVVWVLGVIGAPTIVTTVIWILALLAIVVVLFQLLSGGTGVGRRRRPRGGRAP
jgi:uncharacterized membrane protein